MSNWEFSILRGVKGSFTDRLQVSLTFILQIRKIKNYYKLLPRCQHRETLLLVHLHDFSFEFILTPNFTIIIYETKSLSLKKFQFRGPIFIEILQHSKENYYGRTTAIPTA